MSAILSGSEARRALRRRVDAECELNSKQHAQADAVETAHDYAMHAYSFWPDVKKMERALSRATVEKRKKAKAIILELHNQSGATA